MKKYENTNSLYGREHTIEITIQLGEYKGNFKQQILGNCFGLDILECFDPEILDEYDKFLDNNCNLTIKENDYGELWFSCILTNDKGEKTKYENEIEEFANLVVKLEIVDCKITK